MPSTLFNTVYTYYVTSLVAIGPNIVESLPSNTASGIVKRIFVAGITASRYYLDANPPVLFTLSGSDLPTTAAISCTTLALPGSDAGLYPITCSGPATTANPVNAIVYANGSLTVLPRPQSIAFGALPNKTFGNPPFGLTATASSGLTVFYTASGNCTVLGSLVTRTSAGS